MAGRRNRGRTMTASTAPSSPTMRILLVGLVAATVSSTACTAPAPLTAKSTATGVAVETYRTCTYVAMGSLRSTGKAEAAKQLATSAEAKCAAQRKAVRDAVMAENAAEPSRREAFAETYTNNLRDSIIKGMADDLLTSK